MRIIELDGTHWTTALDFHRSLYDGIEQGYPHGLSVDAFIDSMIWRGMGGVEPPYAIHVINVKDAPEEVRDEIALMISAIKKARRQRFASQGVDIEVSISCREL